MAYVDEHMPRYKPLSVSGYHIREARATAAQELAFTLADGFAYVELGQSRGLDVNSFAPGLSFFFDAHVDFFEEIAKFRAARRIWARWLRDVYGATDERAQWLRFHTQTAGVSLTGAQPINNVVRTAVEALAACWAGPTRCTPTRWTRCWRCPRHRLPRSPSARSRSSCLRPA